MNFYFKFQVVVHFMVAGNGLALGKAGHLGAVGVKPLKSLQFVKIVKLHITD